MSWESLSEEQRNAVTYSGRHLLVKGFSGTGKTTVLTARAKFLQDAGVPSEKIITLSPATIDRITCQRLEAAGIEHILIDEVQDLTPPQRMSLQSLASHCDLFCVGDETQSINSYNGADWRSIRRFTLDFPGTEVMTLTKNFRNTQEIQDLAIWLLKQSPMDYRIEVPQARCAGQVPLLFCSKEKYNLYDAIAEDIKRNVTQYGYRYEDHLLLAREEGDLYGPRISLTRRGVPCLGPETIQQKRYQGDHIKRLITPLVRYSDTDTGPDPGSALAEARKRLEESLQPDSYIFKERYQKEYDELQELANQAQTVRQFFRLLEEHSVVVKKTRYKNDNCIGIETIRNTKAREAEICYLWDITRLRWPSFDERWDPDQVEEARRSLSLGITRARSKVVILCADYPFCLQKTRSKILFFFLREVGTRVELIDSFEEKRKK